MDTFPIFVESVSDHGRDAMCETPQVHRLSVSAWRTLDATHTALCMVAARGRNPISVEVDWENF
jgi:hypothetical protein